MKKDDSKLIWESYQGDNFEPGNKFRGPGSPGVNHAKGYLLQAMELIEDEDVHLCADRGALETTIGALKKAIMALSKNIEDVPETESFEYGGHFGQQRRDSIEKQAYVVADSQGVYGVYSTMQGAAEARNEISGGSYVVGVSVDVDPQQYDEISDMDLNPDQLEETRGAPKGKHYTKHGALKSGDADADGDGGPKFRSDPTDKPGKGD